MPAKTTDVFPRSVLLSFSSLHRGAHCERQIRAGHDTASSSKGNQGQDRVWGRDHPGKTSRHELSFEGEKILTHFLLPASLPL